MKAKPFVDLTPEELSRSAIVFESVARRAYEAYAVSSGNQNFRGDRMPTWGELPAAIRGHWRAAVEAVGEAK